MPRRGENIRKRADGRWEGRYKSMSVASDENAHYKSVYGKSYHEVKQKLIASQQTEQLNAANCTSAYTFSECMSAWLKNVAQTRKYSTCVKYQYVCECHLNRFANKTKNAETTREMCEKYLIEEQAFGKKQLSLSTMKIICHVLNQILKYGNSNIKVSLPEKVTHFYKYESKEITAFSIEDQIKLLNFLNVETAGTN